MLCTWLGGAWRAAWASSRVCGHPCHVRSPSSGGRQAAGTQTNLPGRWGRAQGRGEARMAWDVGLLAVAAWGSGPGVWVCFLLLCDLRACGMGWGLCPPVSQGPIRVWNIPEVPRRILCSNPPLLPLVAPTSADPAKRCLLARLLGWVVTVSAVGPHPEACSRGRGGAGLQARLAARIGPRPVKAQLRGQKSE